MTDLNLAGVQPLPEQPSVAPPEPAFNLPTFSSPDHAQPALQAFDLGIPGVILRSPLAPDPLLPDLAQYEQPPGLDVQAPPGDPAVPDLDSYDRPDALTFLDPFQPDPSLPDLQHPVLTPQVTMPGRPGELAPTALPFVHHSPDFQQLPEGDTYERSYMLQPGSSWRTRHQGTLAMGLERVEES